MPDPLTLVTVPQFERNLFHHVGTDKSFQFTIYRLDKVTPVDLTAWVALSFIIHRYGDPNIVYVTKTAGSGVVFTNRTAGLVTITISATDIANMLPDTYHWRLERTDSGSDYVPDLGTYTLLSK